MLLAKKQVEFVTDASNLNLIAPPTEEVIYPYRRVWRSVGLETGLLFTLVLVVVFGSTLVTIPQNQWLLLAIVLSAAPLILWVIFSWLSEQRVPQPRTRMLAVVVLSALVANGVGYPFITHILQIESWVTRGSVTEQILVYIFAYGVFQEVLKYLVLRHTIWVQHVRVRYDLVAYGAAAAVAYAAVWNFHIIFENNPPPAVIAILVFVTNAQQVVGSLIVAYGMAETRLATANPILTLGMVSVAGIVNGFVTVLANNLANTRLSLAVSSPRQLVDLLLALLMLIGIALSVAFLMRTSERNAELAQGEE
jgi:hypothetical protein